MTHGPHHRTSGHFAIGQHAVERLNKTSLNQNEVFINQLLDKNLQQQAEASFTSTQIDYNTKQLKSMPSNVVENKSKYNTKLFPVNFLPQQDQIQLIPTPTTSIYNNHAVHQYHNHGKHQIPLIYQHPQQIPLIYEYAQHHAPQVNYFYQQHKPQDVIYHQQPIVSMADLQQSYTFLPTTIPSQILNNGNINVKPQNEIKSPNENDGKLLQVQIDNGVTNQAAAANQEIAKITDDKEKEKANEANFNTPIVVDEGNVYTNDETIIVQQKSKKFDDFQPQQKQFNVQILTGLDANEADSKEIATNAAKVVNGHTNSNNYQYLVEDDQEKLDSIPSTQKEAPSRQFLRNFKKFNTYESTTQSPSYSTAFSTTRTVTSTSSSCCKEATSSCCKNDEEKTVRITQKPISNNFLAPVHAGIRLTSENLDDCIDGHPLDNNFNNNYVVTKKVPVFGDRIIFSTTPTPKFIATQSSPVLVHQPTVVVTQPPPPVVTQPIFIEKTQQPKVFHHPIVVQQQQIIKEVPVDRPVYIKSPPETKIVDRPVYIKSPPEIIEKIVHQPYLKTVEKPVFIEKIVKQPVEIEKIVNQPIYIKSPPETKIVQQQVFVEKPIIKEVKVPVEKIVNQPIYIKSPPETKIVHQPYLKTVEKPVFIEKIVKQPVEVERIVEKIVDRPITVEKPIYVDRIVDRPVEKIVEKPVYHTIEKYIDRPVIQTVEKIVEKPVIQTVEKPVYYEKIIDRPVEKIVEKPVIQTVEKFIDRPVVQTVEKIVVKNVEVEKPVYIEKIVDRPVDRIVEKPIIQTVEKIVEKPVIQTVEKFIDRPYPVPYAVPIEKHVYHKPDFHVIAKAAPNKHKLFDFNALFRFLTKKEEVKHIYIPSSPQHQLNQLNKHHLIASYATIEPIKESPVLDYSSYATSHLNPIKPEYGIPTTNTLLLKPVGGTYSNPDPYANGK